MIEGWLDQHGHKVTERWFGNVRLALNTWPPMEARGEVHYLQDLRLGEGVELLAYEVDGLFVEPSGAVDLTLYWATQLEIEEGLHCLHSSDRRRGSSLDSAGQSAWGRRASDVGVAGGGSRR